MAFSSPSKASSRRSAAAKFLRCSRALSGRAILGALLSAMALACTLATIGLLWPATSQADGPGSGPAMRRLRANAVIGNLTNTIGSKFGGSDTNSSSMSGWIGWVRKGPTLSAPAESLLETEAPQTVEQEIPYPLEADLECPRFYQRIRQDVHQPCCCLLCLNT